MTPQDLLRVFECRRRGLNNFQIAEILGFDPQDINAIKPARNYAIFMPVGDGWKKELEKLDEHG